MLSSFVVAFTCSPICRGVSNTSLDVPGAPNSCPTSPHSLHKPMRSSGSETNVWSRLSNSSNATLDTRCVHMLQMYARVSDIVYSKGSIQVEKVDPKKLAGKVLHCTHTACGHSASVLSLFATQNYLFSGSQGYSVCVSARYYLLVADRTVKVWNLKTCTELLTLDKHFSYVRCVHFCPRSNIIFTASQSHIKVSLNISTYS